MVTGHVGNDHTRRVREEAQEHIKCLVLCVIVETTAQRDQQILRVSAQPPADSRKLKRSERCHQELLVSHRTHKEMKAGTSSF